MSKNRLLLLSNSKNPEEDYLRHAEAAIIDFLGKDLKRVLFIPFARVLPSFADFAAPVRASFETMGYALDSVHELSDQLDAVTKAEAIVMGGGNTFHLLHMLYGTGLLNVIRMRVRDGIPYIGWSAGSNVACPTIKTTNDMPILEPQSFDALGLVPFQINPHYTDCHPPALRGETREERIAEFVEVNPGVYVVGLREGSMLRIEGSVVKLLGKGGARVFKKGRTPTDFTAEDSLQFLLSSVSACGTTD
jgi:dipeptidase E